jgi:hypothetical protein
VPAGRVLGRHSRPYVGVMLDPPRRAE